MNGCVFELTSNPVVGSELIKVRDFICGELIQMTGSHGSAKTPDGGSGVKALLMMLFSQPCADSAGDFHADQCGVQEIVARGIRLLRDGER